MSLTMGSGPFGHHPAGRFNLDIPAGEVLFVDPSPRWIRAVRDGATVIDSRRVKMLHQHGALGRYYFPRDDVRWDRLADVEPVLPPAGAPGLEDHVTFPWDARALRHPRRRRRARRPHRRQGAVRDRAADPLVPAASGRHRRPRAERP